MDKSISDFISGFTNVCEGKVTIGRETTTNGIEFIVISIDGKELYKFWNNPQKKPTDKPPKHTGGKASYVKLLTKSMAEHKELSIESAGFIQKVVPNIQWKNNLLIDTRSKKALNSNDLSLIINKSKPFTLKIINELKTSGLLIKDKEGYKLSPELIQKGGKK